MDIRVQAYINASKNYDDCEGKLSDADRLNQSSEAYQNVMRLKDCMLSLYNGYCFVIEECKMHTKERLKCQIWRHGIWRDLVHQKPVIRKKDCNPNHGMVVVSCIGDGRADIKSYETKWEAERHLYFYWAKVASAARNDMEHTPID